MSCCSGSYFNRIAKLKAHFEMKCAFLLSLNSAGAAVCKPFYIRDNYAVATALYIVLNADTSLRVMPLNCYSVVFSPDMQAKKHN